MVKGAALARIQVGLHIAILAMVIAQLPTSRSVREAFRRGLEAGDLEPTLPVLAHFMIGALILVTVLGRLLLRRTDAAQSLFGSALVDVLHGVVYANLLLMPVAGAMAWTFVSPLMAEAHGALWLLLMLTWPLHALAVLWEWRRG